MKINGIAGMTDTDITRELDRGAKFVVFQYTISIIVISFRRSSDIYFISAGSTGFTKGLPFILVSLFLGWWGIPWGPIHTLGSLANNMSGGKNVTQELMRIMNSSEAVA